MIEHAISCALIHFSTENKFLFYGVSDTGVEPLQEASWKNNGKNWMALLLFLDYKISTYVQKVDIAQPSYKPLVARY